MNFTEKDIKQIEAKGLTIADVESQIELFKTGIPNTNISNAATINNGLIKLDSDLVGEYVNHFESNKNNIQLLKFVPASGAATRMFKFLFKFLDDYNPNKESLNAFINKNNFRDLALFLVGLEKFPFYNQIV